MALAIQEKKSERIWGMNIYLATWLEDSQAKSLTKIDYRNRLLSYFFISQSNQFDLKTYVRKGIIKTKNENISHKSRN